MTRANGKPLKRVVLSQSGDLVAEITDRVLTLRPFRTKRGGRSEVVVAWGSIYLRAMAARVEEELKAKRRARRARKGGTK
jgi:hypothetical protein